jgi:hypothetical protein
MVSGKALSVDDWDNPQPDAQDEDDDGGSWGRGWKASWWREKWGGQG